MEAQTVSRLAVPAIKARLVLECAPVVPADEKAAWTVVNRAQFRGQVELHQRFVLLMSHAVVETVTVALVHLADVVVADLDHVC